MLRFGAHQFLAQQGHAHFADGREEHGTVNDVIKTAKDRVGDAHWLGFVAFGKPIAQGQATHATVPHSANPIDGRNKEPIHHAPSSL